MPKISYVSASGEQFDVEAAVGTNLMQAAMDNSIAGINGDCGGAGQCATCHCYIEAPWAAKLGPVEEMEDAMLDCTAEPRLPTSRLSCAVTINAELDGIVVRLPATQI
jgi:ferredoxin, 2Fe-2S